MARDINHVILTGIVDSAPRLLPLKNGRTFCQFVLLNVERYELADGSPATHENYFSVEVFGKGAERTMQDVRQGARYVISGYLRVDDIEGIERTRVRAFKIQSE